MANINNTLEYILSRADDAEAFAIECEEKYNEKIKKIAKVIVEDRVRRVVMLAGPSSSGKTTTAKKLRQALKEFGVDSHAISLDDFYLNNCDAPRFPDGTPDFETVEALDIPLFEGTMQRLLRDSEAEVPRFDFLSGSRASSGELLRLKESDVIIVEGLHALNPVITKHLPEDMMVKIYISVSSRIYDKEKNIILNKRNLRFIRRMIRDYKFRGNSVQDTFKMWITVRYGEDAYLFPYRDNAHFKINTIHLYETCVLKDCAIRLLSEVERESPFFSESRRLIRSLEKFPQINPDIVPADSLLREFIGEKE